MDVFDLDRRVVNEYSDFARSFTKMRSADIRARVDEQYASDRFWPEPILQLNPHFQVGASVGDLVAGGLLHPDTAKFFRQPGAPAGEVGPPFSMPRRSWPRARGNRCASIVGPKPQTRQVAGALAITFYPFQPTPFIEAWRVTQDYGACRLAWRRRDWP